MVFRRGPGVADFLAWWGRVLETGSRVNPSAGYFVDQMWFQHAPGFVESCVEIRHAGYNVGHWNLMQRAIQFVDGEYRVGDEPLRFFHRSGADLDNSEQVSRHDPRLRIQDHPGLSRLLRDHDHAIERSRWVGSTDLRNLRYSYGFLGDGLEIPLAWRRAYARMYPESQAADRRSRFELETSPCNSLARGVPAYDGVALTDLIHDLWRSEPYLQARFDIGSRVGQSALFRWLADEDDGARWRVLEAEAVWRSGPLRGLLRAVVSELVRRGRLWIGIAR